MLMTGAGAADTAGRGRSEGRLINIAHAYRLIASIDAAGSITRRSDGVHDRHGRHNSKASDNGHVFIRQRRLSGASSIAGRLALSTCHRTVPTLLVVITSRPSSSPHGDAGKRHAVK